MPLHAHAHAHAHTHAHRKCFVPNEFAHSFYSLASQVSLRVYLANIFIIGYSKTR